MNQNLIYNCINRIDVIMTYIRASFMYNSTLYHKTFDATRDEYESHKGSLFFRNATFYSEIDFDSSGFEFDLQELEYSSK